MAYDFMILMNDSGLVSYHLRFMFAIIAVFRSACSNGFYASKAMSINAT